MSRTGVYSGVSGPTDTGAVPGLNNIVQIGSIGYTNTGDFCALSGGGQVKCWGYNDSGEHALETGDTFTQRSPGAVVIQGTSNLGYWDKKNSFLYYLQGNVGVGTTTPLGKLTITGTGTGANSGLLVTDATQKTNFTVLDSGNVGIGTTTPYAKLSVTGQTVAEYFTATSTSQVNTFPLLLSTSATTTSLFSTTASSTNLYTSNFFLGSLTGVLRATAGAVAVGLANLASDVTGILPIANGGTGISSTPTYGQLLIGNASGGYTLSATSTLGISISDVTGLLAATKGGTGISSYTTGDLLYATNSSTLAKLAIGFPGQVLKITAGSLPAWGTDVSGAGGSGVSPWATTTNDLAVYPLDTSDVVIVGNSGTSTLASVFEVIGKSYFSDNVGIGTTSAGSILSIGGVANFTGATSTFYGTGGINLTAGCFSVNGACLSTATGGTAGQVTYFTGSASQAGTSTLFISTDSKVGVASSSPWAKFSISSADLGASPAFAIGSSTGTQFVVDSGGRVGIGTSSPYAQLGVNKTASAAQLSLGYDASTYTDFRTDATGNLWILPVGSSGGGVYLPNDNLYVCSGGSLTSNACPTGTPSGAGNLIVQNKAAIGTSTPNWNLTVAGTRPSIDISDTSAGTNLKHWVISSMGGNLYIGTSTDAYATTTVAALTLTNGGGLGLGTTTPTKQFSISDLLYVGASGASGLGTATSTFQGDIRITGKLDVGTIDPVYTIGGVKYATYGHSTVGIFEETLQTLSLNEKDASGKYTYRIAFDELEKGSDLWLFYQITDFGVDWKKMVVTLTPSFKGAVYYEKAPAENALLIRSDTSGEVSMRLTAARYDSAKWPNLRTDQNDKEYLGHEVELKPVKAAPATEAPAASVWLPKQ